jgi:2-C-methyl-D-erythritol 2,4-cyclodiphosphate synthase
LIRVGSGLDAHAFEEGRPLVLGGLEVAGHAGLAGHSDADVVCHAVTDALLGAAKLGDLGSRFPGTDRWLGASSLEILAETARFIVDAGWRIGNVDATVVAQAPRLAPYLEAMAGNVAGALGLEADAVSVKATSTDALGFTGRGEGIAALATVLIER